MENSTTKKLNNIAVFCGASPGNDSAYGAAAEAMGKAMCRRGIGLVYGGGTVGLMGKIARTVLDISGPGAIYGVIPKELAPRELSGEMVGEVVYTDDMHTRKALMAKRADGFIGMPGGFGTLEELLEVITWQQLGFHAKPIGLLNINGFYDPLIQFFDKCVSSGFIKAVHRDKLIISDDPEELINQMEKFKPGLSDIELARMAASASHAVGMDVSMNKQ